MRKIILASGSKQRKLLFETLGLSFEIIPSNIDEKAVAFTDLVSRAENIARAKAEAVAKDHLDAVVIAADTYVVKDNKALEKPHSLAEAEAMITNLSGTNAIAYSGYCYIDRNEDINQSGVAETLMRFRSLSPQFIKQYVANNPVKDWSAAFSPAYHQGMALVDSIEGSFTNFTHGLPLEIIVPLLEKSGIKV